MLYTKNAGDEKYSRDLDWVRLGRRRYRTMMLVYNLPGTDAIYDRFGGIDSSAYLSAASGMTARDLQ
jgi:hypothetical protein